MSHIATAPHECEGNLIFTEHELSPYWLATSLLVEEFDGYGEMEVDIDGESWTLSMTYQKGGIAPRPEDQIGGERLYEVRIGAHGRGERKANFLLQPRFREMRHHETGKSISTPFDHIPADEGVNVRVSGSNLEPERFADFLPRFFQAPGREAGSWVNGGYLAGTPHEMSNITTDERCVRINREWSSKVERVAMGESTKTSEDIAADAEVQSKEVEQKSREVGLVQDLDERQPADIIEGAKPYGWTNSHPDVGNIGYPDRPFDPLVHPDVVKRPFTQSQVLRNKGRIFEMLDRQLTENEDAPYQKLYRMSIPEGTDPPVSGDPPDDTVQAMDTESGEVLVPFGPEVLEWYPSVMIPLPQHELFEYPLGELVDELGKTTEGDVVRVAGNVEDGGCRIWREPLSESSAQVATYATTADHRLTLDVPSPAAQTAEEDLRKWLSRHLNSNSTK